MDVSGHQLKNINANKADNGFELGKTLKMFHVVFINNMFDHHDYSISDEIVNDIELNSTQTNDEKDSLMSRVQSQKAKTPAATKNMCPDFKDKTKQVMK